MISHHLFVGTVGQAVFRSLDHGVNFQRAAEGMFVECTVRALAVDPIDHLTLYLGSEDGVFMSRDQADTWTALFTPPQREAVWSLAVTKNRIVVGTSPSRIFVSQDKGQTWEMAQAAMTQECPRIRFTRVTSLLVDALDENHLYAGVEIDGLHESRDGGMSFSRIESEQEPLTSLDIHSLALAPGLDGVYRLLATTNRDLNLSADKGHNWQAARIDRVVPWIYTRALCPLVDVPSTLLLGTGTGPPGWQGHIARSTDGGVTWMATEMPSHANSTIWAFAVHQADPALVYAASVSGQIYRSTDSGQSWERLDREFGEVRALAWTPR